MAEQASNHYFFQWFECLKQATLPSSLQCLRIGAGFDRLEDIVLPRGLQMFEYNFWGRFTHGHCMISASSEIESCELSGKLCASWRW